eukprot:Phypoly_transcript_00582.p1 GENE.Phypoly_transcript_00582~~Phypoly_transcript_00582.p1  ORF type:complete len:1139 (+),score=118.91 Phypoly_transcript_00582:978-4394(+)
MMCDNCRKQLIDPIKVVSLKSHGCMECLDFDLCEECFAKIGHQHPTYTYYGPPIEKFNGTTVQDCLLFAFRAHNGRPIAGVRDGDKFKWHTYEEVGIRSRRFAAGLRTLNIPAGGFMATCAPNSIEYMIADYGGILCGITVVPIHMPFGQNEVDYIIQSVEAFCVVCSVSVIMKFLNSMNVNSCLKHIIQIEPPSATPPEIMERAKEQNVDILFFDDICTKGDVENFIPTKRQPEDLFSVTFTSGSTGTPKGVMLSNKAAVIEITDEFHEYYIGMCIGPYAHSERQNLIHIVWNGGRMGIASGNMEQLVDEFKLVNPTALNAVPRFWNMLYSQYKNEVALLEKSDPENALIAPALVAEKFKPLLGCNIRAIVSGGAPVGEPVLEFMRMCFGVPVINGYASTEAGSLASNERIDDDVEMKLENWGEYTTDDQPFPRGEICVRTKCMATGYWKDEKTTEEMFRDGWFHTGDIGEQEDKSHIRIIDRKKNLFKLAQGEFVAPEHVENTLLASKFVKQIFVTGSTTQSFLVAVIVPERETVAEWALQNNIHVSAESIESFFSDLRLIGAIQADLFTVGLQAQLPPFQIPRASYLYDNLLILIIATTISNPSSFVFLPPFQIPRALYLYDKTFTAENRLMTASNKINRVNLEKEFKGIAAELYEKAQPDTISTTNRTDEQVLQEIISQYAPGLESNEDSIFLFGVDSISAVQITTAIKQFFKIDIELHDLYNNPTKSGILAAIRSAKVPTPPSKSTLKKLRKRLENDSLLPEEIVPSFDTDANITTTDIFLTGATGFLGAYLLLELLRQTTANIHCLVRAESEEAGTEKLLKNLEYYMWVIEPYRTRIFIVNGDLAKPLFGLEQEKFDSLARKIDSIYHCGAMVNGIWPYDAHKSHNVDGTIAIIKLAAKGRPKKLFYISTISVFRNASTNEDEILHPKAGITRLSGYGQSKWVAERLCLEARARGIPTTLFRFGTISGDSTTGRSHNSDFINRLIAGLAFMGIYPSVYADVEMTPVDYAARACIYISLQGENLGKNFHVVNPDPPFSLTDLAVYVSNFGYSMKEVGFKAWKAVIPRDQKNPLFALSSYFTQGFPTTSQIKCTNTTAALANAPFTCPTNVEEWVAKYLQTFVDEKIIKKPRSL